MPDHDNPKARPVLLAGALAAAAVAVSLAVGSQPAPPEAAAAPATATSTTSATSATSTSTAPQTSAAKPATPAAGAQYPRDAQGFTDSAARCDQGQTLAVFGRTARALVVVCEDGDGELEYRGVRLSDEASLAIPAGRTSGGSIVATNEGVTYSISPTMLLVSEGDSVLYRDSWAEFGEASLAESPPAESPAESPADQDGGTAATTTVRTTTVTVTTTAGPTSTAGG
ncbi:MAG: hypothetical protein ACKOB8_11865 [Mycobacterium sp.]